MLMRKILSIVCAFALVCLASCEGGTTSLALVGADGSLANLFEVRMAPQPPDQAGLKIASMPTPSAVVQLPAPRTISALEDEVTRQGSSYDTSLPRNRVSPVGNSAV